MSKINLQNFQASQQNTSYLSTKHLQKGCVLAIPSFNIEGGEWTLSTISENDKLNWISVIEEWTSCTISENDKLEWISVIEERGHLQKVSWK